MSSNSNESSKFSNLYKLAHSGSGHVEPPISSNNDNCKYLDNAFKGSVPDYKKKLEESTTIYAGNLNLFSTEKDIHNQFSKAGNIKNIIMGLEKKTMSPGGFCFVEYETHTEAENCISTMKENTLLDGYKLLIDWDAGFKEGRQYTRRKNKKFMLNYPSL